MSQSSLSHIIEMCKILERKLNAMTWATSMSMMMMIMRSLHATHISATRLHHQQQQKQSQVSRESEQTFHPSHLHFWFFDIKIVHSFRANQLEWRQIFRWARSREIDLIDSRTKPGRWSLRETQNFWYFPREAQYWRWWRVWSTPDFDSKFFTFFLIDSYC